MLCTAIIGLGALAPLLESCGAAGNIYKAQAGDENKILVPVAELAGKNYLTVRTPQLNNDILIVKENEQKYHTLLMRCTHQDNALVVTSTGLVCNAHGSRFDMEGNVTKEPATRPLQRFKTEIINSNISINLNT